MHTKLTIWILLATISYCSTTSNLTVDPLTSFFKDQAGRYIFIHGVNSVYKQYPYYPVTDHFDQNSSLSMVDWINLQSWGFKAVRLYISWQGFQPKEGQYNYSYLEKLKQIVKTAEQFDIGIILDVHHDLYSRKFCGQGFPDWIVTKLTFPAPFKLQLQYDVNGIPTKESCMKKSFFQYYATYDVMKFSHEFFTNKNGMADKFVSMWEKVVAFFVNQNNVIGYDLINQPSGADGWKNIYSFLAPGSNNNKFLLPFYKKLISAIRKIQTDKLVLFEPCVVDYFGGFYQNPDQSCPNKAVMSYHTYCPFKNDHAEPTSSKKCNIIDGYYINSRVNNIKKIKVGGMMTEFGSVPQSQKGLQQIQRVIGYAEQYWQSWFYWQFKYNADSTCSSNPPWQHSFYYPNGDRQQKKIKILSHPYAFAICGDPISQTHSQYSYTLTLKPRKCGNKYTEIYLNEDQYFNQGFGISFDPPCQKCSLRSLSRGSFELVVSEEVLYKKLILKVANKI